MQNFKDKLYNYETPPPTDLWDKIVEGLDEQKVIQLPGLRRKSKVLFYSLTAAAAVVIILISSVFFNKSNDNNAIANTASATEANSVVSQIVKDSIEHNHEKLESIITTTDHGKLLASNDMQKKIGSKEYIIIAGPEGQPVKISSKAATLIISTDNEFPPKTVWDKKIDEWQQIMLSSTMATTPINLIDLMEKASVSD